MATDISQLSNEELDALIAQQSSPATVTTKPGIENLTNEQLDALIKAQTTQQQGQVSDKSILGQAGAGIAGVARGATIGLSDPAIAGVYAGVEAVKEKAVGDQRPITEIAKEKYQEGVGAVDTLKEKYPVESTVGEIAGAFAPSPINVGSKVIGAGEAVGKIAAEKLAPGLIKSGVERAIGGAAGGIGLGATQGVANIAQGKEAPDLTTSAAIGAGAQLAAPVVVGAAKGAVKIGKSVVDTISEKLFRVSPELAKQFVARAKEILSAPTVEQFNGKIKKLIADAGGDYQILRDDITTLIKESIDNQNRHVSELSSKAFDVLDKAVGKKGQEVRIDTRAAALGMNKLKATMMPFLERTKVGGVTIDPQSAKKIQTMFDTIDSMERYIPATEVKRWIQYIDNESANIFATDPALKGSQYERGLIKFREELNKRLGNAVPEYKRFMETKVAPATRFKIQLDERFGSDGKINQALNKWEKEILTYRVPKNLEIGPRRQEIQNVVAPTESFVAGPVKDNAMVVMDQLNKMEDIVRGLKKSGPVDSTLNSFFKSNALVKQDPATGRTLIYLNQLTDENLSKIADNVQLRKMYDNIVPQKFSDLFNPAFIGLGGYGVSNMMGIDPYTVGAAIFLTGTFGPMVAKQALNGMANMQGFPTVAKLKSLPIPEDAKNKLISGFVQYVNQSSNRGPITIGSPETGLEVQKFLKQLPDPILRAKNLTSLHKDQSVDPEVAKNVMLQGMTPGEFGSLSKYLESKIAPGIKQKQPSEKAMAQPGEDNTLLTFGGYEDLITKSANETGVPVELFAALIRGESNFNPKAVSPTGAKGMAQFVKDTAIASGLKVHSDPSKDERFIPEKALPASAKLLANLYGKYNSWPLALTAYNAGETAVNNALKAAKGNEKKAISLMKKKEARQYAGKILGYYNDIVNLKSQNETSAMNLD